MKLRLLTATVTMALLTMFIITPLNAGAAPVTSGATATLTNTVGTVTSTVPGTLTNLQAVLNAATGVTTITGTFTDALGNITNFTTTLLSASGSCQILDLVLGPLTLNLLGVVVTLNQVHLNITAQPGPGNLLGNLLCAVANLLNTGGPLQGITGLLNNIFRHL